MNDTPEKVIRFCTFCQHSEREHEHYEPHRCRFDDGVPCNCEAFFVSPLINTIRAAQGLSPANDPVNHPAHYTAYKNLEIIDLTEQMNFCRGNAVKYIARAGIKNPETEIEDLEKAVWYLNREIKRLKEAGGAS